MLGMLVDLEGILISIWIWNFFDRVQTGTNVARDTSEYLPGGGHFYSGIPRPFDLRIDNSPQRSSINILYNMP
jgi:hypothetical protein